MQTAHPSLTISDSDAIKKVLDGKTGLFEVLIRRNNPFLYKTGMSYGFNHHDTEDLMQDAFIAAYVNLRSFEHRSSFKTWVVKIMLHLCYKRTQKLSFKNEISLNATFTGKSSPMFTPNQNKDVHEAAVNKELSHAIESALTKLPMEYRMVFSFRELNGMSTAETAEALDITESNVKVRLNRAKHMLRELIEKTYTPQDIFEFNLIYCDKITREVMEKVQQCELSDISFTLSNA